MRREVTGLDHVQVLGETEFPSDGVHAGQAPYIRIGSRRFVL